MADQPGAGYGHDVDPSDRAGLARSRAAALSRLQDVLAQMAARGFSAGHPVCEITTDNFALLASATAAHGSFEVMISVNCHPEPLDILEGSTLDLRIRADLHFLAVIDETGTAIFSGIPAADWEIRSLERLGVARSQHSFAMPQMERSGALAASPARSFLREIHAPDGKAVFTVRTPPGDTPTLEIDLGAATTDETPFLIPVSYHTGAGHQMQLIAAVGRRRDRLYTAISLTDFDPYGEWSASDPVDPSLLSRWAPEVIRESISAAGIYPRAREFWLRAAELAPPIAAEAIRSTIG